MRNYKKSYDFEWGDFPLLILAALVSLSTCASPASAQRQRISPELALARICVSEAGWDCFETGDGYAIHEVILRGSTRHDISYTSYARAYSGRAVGSKPYIGQRTWIPFLVENGDEPRNWRTPLYRTQGGAVRVLGPPPWSQYRARWLAVLEHARRVVRLSLSDIQDWGRCGQEVHDWGGSMDRDRARRLGLIEVECGETQNYFYRRPSIAIGVSIITEP